MAAHGFTCSAGGVSCQLSGSYMTQRNALWIVPARTSASNWASDRYRATGVPVGAGPCGSLSTKAWSSMCPAAESAVWIGRTTYEATSHLPTSPIPPFRKWS